MPSRWTCWGFPLCLTFLLALGGCNKGETPEASINASSADSTAPADGTAAAPTDTNTAAPRVEPPAPLPPRVLIKTSRGDVLVELDLQNAPITVDNFLSNYVERGFYNGTIFHHVEPNCMVLGGGYTAEGQEKPTRTEIANEAYNGLKNARGTIAMARDRDYADSATSQFFFNLGDNAWLDHQGRDSAAEFGYCVFGRVVEGLDVLDRIGQSPTTQGALSPQQPAEPVVIESIQRVQ